MLSNIPQAVETATSYCSLMEAKSPSLPNTPTFESSPPFFEAFRIPCTALERAFPPPVARSADFASSTFVRSSLCCRPKFSSSADRSRSSRSNSTIFFFEDSNSFSCSFRSLRFDSCVPSSASSSDSASKSLSFARFEESSNSFSSVSAVPSSACKTARSCLTGANSVVFASSLIRISWVIALLSSSISSNFESSSDFDSVSCWISASRAGICSSAFTFLFSAAVSFFSSAFTFVSSFFLFAFSCFTVSRNLMSLLS
mmetsp:Transcript_13710/g.32105  ORF Transcript_13710/g.32105 Transcript_13710/m.32105 type:complete len:257 (-) Transcript_13710:1185-1955(-)